MKTINHSQQWKAFSLVELLAVISIIAVMIGMIAPAVGSLGVTGRKGAVSNLMTAFEQARVVALESGSETFVVMKRAVYPDADAFIVYRRKGDLDDPAAPTWIQMSKWTKLPSGVVFFQANSTLTDSGSVPSDLISALPNVKSGETHFCISFNRHGGVQYPSANNDLYLGEAVREGASEQKRQASQQITEKFSFAKFTGRVQLEISSLN